MGVFFDYFSAPDDQVAGSVIDREGGPIAPDPSDEPQAPRGLLRLRRGGSSGRRGTGSRAFDGVDGKGIDPMVQLATLESLLTGRDADEILEDPLHSRLVETRDEGTRAVVAVSPRLVAVLVAAEVAELDRVAVPWSQTEEFWGAATPGELRPFLHQLAGLARRAAAADLRLYCWVCV